MFNQICQNATISEKTSRHLNKGLRHRPAGRYFTGTSITGFYRIKLNKKGVSHNDDSFSCTRYISSYHVTSQKQGMLSPK